MIGIKLFRKKKSGFIFVTIGVISDIQRNGFPILIVTEKGKNYGTLQFANALQILNAKKTPVKITFTTGKGDNVRPFTITINDSNELQLLKLFIKEQLKTYFEVIKQITTEKLHQSYIEYLNSLSKNESSEEKEEDSQDISLEETNDLEESSLEDEDTSDLDNIKIL